MGGGSVRHESGPFLSMYKNGHQGLFPRTWKSKAGASRFLGQQSQVCQSGQLGAQDTLVRSVCTQSHTHHAYSWLPACNLQSEPSRCLQPETPLLIYQG